MLSRREVLKALATVGGAAAASALLPEKWVQPVVEAGVVPVHAQSSLLCVSPYTIDRCVILELTRNGNDLRFVSVVYALPACAGVPFQPTIEVLDVNLERLYYSEVPGAAYSNSQGESKWIVSGNFEGQPYLVKVIWKIAYPEFGTDSCTATKVVP